MVECGEEKKKAIKIFRAVLAFAVYSFKLEWWESHDHCTRMICKFIQYSVLRERGAILYQAKQNVSQEQWKETKPNFRTTGKLNVYYVIT